MQKMIDRSLYPIINNWLFRDKIIILYGARQVGKTTLARKILSEYSNLDAYYNCEIPSIKQLLQTKEPEALKREFGSHKVIVLDEAQFIPDIGDILKIIADHLPDIQIIATGSSSFELAQKTGEPLVGRALTFTLYPLSYAEMGSVLSPLDRRVSLDHYLTFGMYPEIVQQSTSDARFLLDDLTSRFLYKDIFMFEDIRKPELIDKLLQALAFQIGSEVSFHELSKILKVNTRTVERYIYLLEQAFVIFRLGPFSRNLRKEISKKQKIFFYDVGIRNSIIQQYQSFENRQDKGVLWENYVIVERIKYNGYQLQSPNKYFWRTHDGQEIDYLEEQNGMLNGFEIKWKARKNKAPAAFENTYPNATFKMIDQANFEEFVI